MARISTTRVGRLGALAAALIVAVMWIAVGLVAPRAQAQDFTPTPDTPPLEGYALGPEDAALTIIMYGDFQCAICARYARDVETVRATYPDDIRLIWRYFPDTRSHDKAALALQAAEAAAAQGRFWNMHAELFAHLDDWIDLSPDDFRAELRQYAEVLGLDVARFDADLDAGTYAGVIEAAQRDAAALDVVGVPFLLYNGVPFSGRDDFFGLEEAARLELLVKRQFAAPPPYTLTPDTTTYRATIVTEKGDIVIDLYPDAAPWAVNSFVFLAQQGWYDDITFFYVIPGFIAQTGDPSNTGRGTPGYTLPDEHANGLRFDQPGRVALAQPDGVPNSAGSAFFITLDALTPSENRDEQFTIFGQVIAGLDVVQALTPRNANDPVNFPDPPSGDRVITVRIEELPR